jgi:hypothetical protein
MVTGQPLPGDLRLRYGTASVFERADTHSKEVAVLAATDAFTVVGAEGEYYRVQLTEGSVGYIYAHNLQGTNMPLTASEQVQSDARAAYDARPPGGLRGIVKRLTGK